MTQNNTRIVRPLELEPSNKVKKNHEGRNRHIISKSASNYLYMGMVF